MYFAIVSFRFALPSSTPSAITRPRILWNALLLVMYQLSRKAARVHVLPNQDQTCVHLTHVLAPKPEIFAARHSLLPVDTSLRLSTRAAETRRYRRRRPLVRLALSVSRQLLAQPAPHQTASARTAAPTVVPPLSTPAAFRTTRCTSARTDSFRQWSRTAVPELAQPMLSKEWQSLEPPLMTHASISVHARRPMFR